MDSAEDFVREAQKVLFEGNGGIAEKLLIKAAGMKSGAAAHELGVLYRTGAIGVSRDPLKSLHWFEISLEMGFEATVSSDPEWFRDHAS